MLSKPIIISKAIRDWWQQHQKNSMWNCDTREFCSLSLSCVIKHWGVNGTEWQNYRNYKVT